MTLSKSHLGQTDLTVSSLCLGTNQFGTALDQEAANALLDAFVGVGGNFVDTARVYGDYSSEVPTGPSERAIGAWLDSRGRDKLVIGTKGGAPDFRNGLYIPRLAPDQLLHEKRRTALGLKLEKADKSE